MREYIEDILTEEDFVVVSHRGMTGGNTIQNTSEAVIAAIYSGADIVELDVTMSLDGTFYLFREGSEGYVLYNTDVESFSERYISEMHDAEIRRFEYLNTQGLLSGKRVETLAEFMEWLPKDLMVILDHTWEFWGDDFFELIAKDGKADQIALKCPVEPLSLALLSATDFYAIPMVHTAEDLALVQNFDLNLLAVELIAYFPTSWAVTSEAIRAVKALDAFAMANFTVKATGDTLYGDIDDELLFMGYVNDASRDEMEDALDNELDLIQTDWPHLLSPLRL